jgi:tetratricopeptide (TPR) repeat protein
LNRNNYDRAISDFSQVIRFNNNHYNAYFYRGNAYFEKGDYTRAVSDYNQVIQLDPDNIVKANAYGNIGTSYFNRNEYWRAIQAYEMALGLDPDNVYAKTNLAEARSRYGR